MSASASLAVCSMLLHGKFDRHCGRCGATCDTTAYDGESRARTPSNTLTSCRVSSLRPHCVSAALLTISRSTGARFGVNRVLSAFGVNRVLCARALTHVLAPYGLSSRT